jgi:hypothetical protein
MSRKTPTRYLSTDLIYPCKCGCDKGVEVVGVRRRVVTAAKEVRWVAVTNPFATTFSASNGRMG